MSSRRDTAQVLAISRIREWAALRQRIKTGKLSAKPGRPTIHSKTASYDGQIVRVVAFERAFERLPESARILLAGVHRDRVTLGEAAHLIGVSTRTAASHLEAAERRLAEILDRLDLL